MKILHTADWHLGQTFYEYDRREEHLHFLEWLKQQIRQHEIDVLLIAGDVFDSPNPSAESQRMYYRFLREVTSENPSLQIIIIAGNHDSAARLEAPNPLLEDMNVTVRGVVRRNAEGDIGRDLSYSQLDQMQELEKMALRERRILNMACVSRKEPSGLLLSADESGSIVLGGDDHIRMQILSPGLKLDELWQKADVLDDYVNERFSYAFDEKYGYLTSFPTNVGTGLRACAVLHLPTLSQVRKFLAS